MAGIIAGDNGLAPEALLWDVRVIGNDGLTTVAILIDALDDLVPDMAQFEILVGAFADPNFRFSSSCDALNPAAASVVQEFQDAGKVLIAAAGDAADSAGVGVPACLSQILAAGAVYDANIGSKTAFGCTDATTAADKIECHSNSGPLLDFLAPGHCASTPKASGGLDDCFGGTSAAAAYAAGVAAQALSLATTATGEQARERAEDPGAPDQRPAQRHRAAPHQRGGGLAGASRGAGHTEPHADEDRDAGRPGPVADADPYADQDSDDAAGGDSGAAVQPHRPTVTHTAVLLKWTDGSNNEDSFHIEVKSAGAFQEVLTVPANTTYAAVEDLFPSTPYTFRVRARTAAGSSNYSNEAFATTAATTAACVRDANTACLLNGQFRVTGAMKNFANPPATFENQVMSFPGGRAESDEAVFWESFEPGNFEVAVKVRDACALPAGHPLRFYWAFFGGLTDKRTDMVVQDTVTGATITWNNPPNTFPTTVANTQAFACVTPGAAGNCVRNDQTACLVGGRFKVTGTMRNAADTIFPTKVIHFAQDRAETDQAVFFQSFDAGNFEVGVKMLNACSLPAGHPLRANWIFYGGLTNADTEIRAVQTSTGRVDIWSNPPGTVPTSVGRNTAETAFPCP